MPSAQVATDSLLEEAHGLLLGRELQVPSHWFGAAWARQEFAKQDYTKVRLKAEVKNYNKAARMWQIQTMYKNLTRHYDKATSAVRKYLYPGVCPTKEECSQHLLCSKWTTNMYSVQNQKKLLEMQAMHTLAKP